MRSIPPSLSAALRLSPLLLLYMVWVLVKAKGTFTGDEGRYFLGAGNILAGFLASEETLYLWNGPGYPFYLAPFAGLGAPLLFAKLGNAVLLFLGMVYFHASSRRVGLAWGNLKITYAMGILLFLHGPALELLMTECLSVFFVCGAAWHFLAGASPAARPWLNPALGGMHLAGLALTKVFFGYALVAGLLAAAVWRASTGARGNAATGSAGRAAFQFALALLFCLPYLAYTWKLTGRIFFWSNSGGSQFYCMTLRENELVGDWLNFDAVLANPEFFKGQTAFYQALAGMDYVTRDEAMKAAAFANIKADPGKYFRNWRANINRMVFGYPRSRYPGADAELATGNRSFVYAAPFFIMCFALPFGWRRRRAIPAEAHACLIFGLASLGGLSLLSAFPRLVLPVLPLLGLWLAAVLGAALDIEGERRGRHGSGEKASIWRRPNG
jgi:hypothetical protein